MSVYENRNNRKARRFERIAGAFFLLCSAVCIVPILHIAAVSLSSKGAILSGHVGIFPVEMNLQAYNKVLRDTGFLKSFVYSMALTAGYTGLAMLATVTAAYPLSKEGLKGRGIIMTAIVLTMYFDPGMIPNYLNIKDLKLLDSVWALILPGLLSAYNLIIMRTFFSGIDKSLYEAAYIDGSSERQILFRIAVPLALPAIATLSLFYAVSRWNGISDVLFYVSKSNLYTVQLKLKMMIDSIVISQEENNLGAASLVAENVKAASIVFSMLPMLILYPFIQKYFTKGIMLGSVKG